jgi:GTP 3',8-cyclase
MLSIPSRILIDRFGRRITDLRISITDRCNFRCVYCIPQETVVWQQRSELLTYEEIFRIAERFVDLGIRKIRLTGGEPMVRHDAEKLVAALSKIPLLEDLAMTTNAYFLAGRLEGLIQAGLKRLNVSLDSLNPRKFALITGRNVLPRVLEGVRQAAASRLKPLKINVVLIRGVNDDEILDFVQLAREIACSVRFIEFMPLEGESSWKRDKVVTGKEILEIIQSVYPLKPQDRVTNSETARRYAFEEGEGEIGFVNPVSQPFCGDCSRMRLTADGKIRTCLFSLHDHDIKSLLRGGASDDELLRAIEGIVAQKEERHHINEADFQRPSRTMSCIGG